MSFVSTDGKTVLTDGDVWNLKVAIAAAVAPVDPPTTIPPRLIPILGGHYTHGQLNWMADWIPADTPGCPGAAQHVVPWEVPMADPAKGIMVQPLGGKLATRIEAWHTTGNPTQYTEMVPLFNAKGLSEPRTSEQGDNFLNIAKWLRANPYPVGPRGTCITHSYGIWIPHPTIDPAVNPRARTVWMFFDHAGNVFEEDRDMALWWRGTIPGFETGDALVDIAFDPGDRHAMTALAASGMVLRINRAAGAASASQAETAARYDVVKLATLSQPRGVMYSPGRQCFIAEHAVGRVQSLADNGAVKDFALLPNAWRLRFKSDGTMVAMTLGGSIRFIDTNGNVGPDLNTKNLAPWNAATSDQSTFVDMDVDVNGTCGPKDRVYATRSHGAGNNDAWRIESDGSNCVSGLAVFGGGNGLCTVGPVSAMHEPPHYGWAVRIHVDQGRMKFGGFATTPVPEFVFDPPTPLPGPDLDYSIVGQGIQYFKLGDATNTQTLPSFSCQMHPNGWGLVTFDEMAKMGFDGCRAFIVKGGLGSFPRPNLAGMPSVYMTAAACMNSQERLKGGAAYVTALVAWMRSQGLTGVPQPTSVMNMGKYGPNNLSPAGDRETLDPCYLEPFLSSNAVWVIVSRDLYGNPSPKAIPTNAFIVADMGMPFQKTDLTTLTPGVHSLTVVVPGQVPPLSGRASVVVV